LVQLIFSNNSHSFQEQNNSHPFQCLSSSRKICRTPFYVCKSMLKDPTQKKKYIQKQKWCFIKETSSSLQNSHLKTQYQNKFQASNIRHSPGDRLQYKQQNIRVWSIMKQHKYNTEKKYEERKLKSYKLMRAHAYLFTQQ